MFGSLHRFDGGADDVPPRNTRVATEIERLRTGGVVHRELEWLQGALSSEDADSAESEVERLGIGDTRHLPPLETLAHYVKSLRRTLECLDRGTHCGNWIDDLGSSSPHPAFVPLLTAVVSDPEADTSSRTREARSLLRTPHASAVDALIDLHDDVDDPEVHGYVRLYLYAKTGYDPCGDDALGYRDRWAANRETWVRGSGRHASMGNMHVYVQKTHPSACRSDP